MTTKWGWCLDDKHAACPGSIDYDLMECGCECHEQEAAA